MDKQESCDLTIERVHALPQTILTPTPEKTQQKTKSRASYMATYRAKFSHQKKNKLKHLDGTRKQKPETNQPCDTSKPKKRRKLLNSPALPQSPNSYAICAEQLIDKATPRKKTALEEKDISTSKIKRKASAYIVEGMQQICTAIKTCSKESSKFLLFSTQKSLKK